jgi:hypothetical protein
MLGPIYIFSVWKKIEREKIISVLKIEPGLFDQTPTFWNINSQYAILSKKKSPNTTLFYRLLAKKIPKCHIFLLPLGEKIPLLSGATPYS